MSGRIEDFNFLITTNLIKVPATRTAIMLLIGQPSGKMTRSERPRTIIKNKEIPKKTDF